MSAYAHQMEQQNSARSLASAGSELESRYVIESGFYMKSVTATIFIASLITLGILLITMLVSLVVMLQTCESRSEGIIEFPTVRDDYSYCKIYSLHAELNNLKGNNNIPKICHALAIQYITGGQYAKDLDSTNSLIEDYFKSTTPSDDGLDVVLMDIDDTFPANPRSSNLFHRFHNYSISDCIEKAKNLKLMFILRLYKNVQADGWPIILLSREPGSHQNVTTNRLLAAGFRGWSSLMMRLEDEDSTKGYGYFSRQRNLIEKKGYRIKSVISSYMDALIVSDTGMRNFKLPDSMCDKLEQQMESTDAID
ncbi:hypothetical protein L6164_032919 [Bauhinia variegata]|uniref:Uncharacterized protein n=1 Tax=Bauhinia variegata TaxID=167791 RepID=A0ACB9KQC2_BAUVA|nr:hypothetical protein L6164_032919 [Bauhinia variegata]